MTATCHSKEQEKVYELREALRNAALCFKQLKAMGVTAYLTGQGQTYQNMPEDVKAYITTTVHLI